MKKTKTLKLTLIPFSVMSILTGCGTDKVRLPEVKSFPLVADEIFSDKEIIIEFFYLLNIISFFFMQNIIFIKMIL